MSLKFMIHKLPGNITMSIIDNLKPIIDEMAKYVSPERLEIFINGLEMAALIDHERVNYAFMSLTADSENRDSSTLAMEYEEELLKQLLSTVRKYEIRMALEPSPDIQTLTRILLTLELVFDYTEPSTILGFLKDELLENRDKIANIINVFYDIDVDEMSDKIEYVSDDLITRFIDEMQKRSSLDEIEEITCTDEVMRQEVALKYYANFPNIRSAWEAFIDQQCSIGLELNSLLTIISLEENDPHVLEKFVFLMIVSNTPLGESAMYDTLQREFPFNVPSANVNQFKIAHREVCNYVDHYHQQK